VLDVVDAMAERPSVLRVDGGASANGFLVQFLADVLALPVEVAAERETTALGAAALAGVALGRWTQDDVTAFRQTSARYEPQRDVTELVAGWHDALRRTLL
jgi:glycerol kinase